MTEPIKKFTCPTCDKAKLFERKNNRTVATDQYADAWMAIGDDEVLKFGLCKECLKNLDDEKCKLALKRFKLFWKDEPEANKKAIDKKAYRCHDRNRNNCLRKLNEYKLDRHKMKLRKLKKGKKFGS